jgi:hypothetical protein
MRLFIMVMMLTCCSFGRPITEILSDLKILDEKIEMLEQIMNP